MSTESSLSVRVIVSDLIKSVMVTIISEMFDSMCERGYDFSDGMKRYLSERCVSSALMIMNRADPRILNMAALQSDREMVGIRIREHLRDVLHAHGIHWNARCGHEPNGDLLDEIVDAVMVERGAH